MCLAVVRNDAETLFWSIPLPASVAAMSADSQSWKVKCSGQALGQGSYPEAPRGGRSLHLCIPHPGRASIPRISTQKAQAVGATAELSNNT